MPDPLEALLEQLCRGDAAAAEQAFRAYEPFLRLVVRRHLPAHLRARFDSVDVVQSVWADAVRGFREAGWRFKDATHLRAFLVTMARNRLHNRVRQHNRSLRHEQSVAASASAESPEPRPDDLAQAEDLWQRMLALCPAGHRDVLLLKRQGYAVADIAGRTGLHPGSVRRILYDLARRVAAG